MTSADVFLAIAIGAPLLAGIFIFVFGRPGVVHEWISLVASSAAAAAAIAILIRVGQGDVVAARLAGLGSGLSLELRVDRLGAVFGMMAAGLWFANTLFAISYAREKVPARRPVFFGCFALAVSAAMGAAYSGNLLTLFVFYELLTLTTYPLVVFSGDERARRAGRTYILYLSLPAAAGLLPAVAAIQAFAGSTDFTPGGLLNGVVTPDIAGALLVLVVLGAAKAALFPFHAWLPAAMAAPTPVSALLHAVAVVKAGVFLILKCSAFIFGPELVAASPASQPLLLLAACTIAGASVAALFQKELKARLAWSTVAQLAFITAAALMGSAAGLVAGGLHMVAHAFGKITLFICAGLIQMSSGVTRVDGLRGLGRETPFVFWSFLLGALCVAGLPPSGGLWSKYMIISETFRAGEGLVAVAMVLSSLLTLSYLAPVALSGLMVAPSPEAAWFRSGVRRLQPQALVGLALAAAGVFVLFFFAGPLADYLSADLGGSPDAMAR